MTAGAAKPAAREPHDRTGNDKCSKTGLFRASDCTCGPGSGKPTARELRELFWAGRCLQAESDAISRPSCPPAHRPPARSRLQARQQPSSTEFVTSAPTSPFWPKKRALCYRSKERLPVRWQFPVSLRFAGVLGNGNDLLEFQQEPALPLFRRRASRN